MVRSSAKQMDLFSVVAVDAATKEQRDLMSRCWFSLANKKRTQTIEHRFGDNFIKITGSEQYGIATIHDSAVLSFATSQYIEALNKGLQIGRRFYFTGYEFWSWMNKHKMSGSGYATLWESLQRLQATRVETNVRVESGTEMRSFNMLSEIKQEVGDDGRHRGYEIVIPEFFFENIKNAKNVLTLSSDYWSLTSSIERWLYLYARRSAGGRKDAWVEDIESVYVKSASLGGLANFKRHIRRIFDRGSLLDYELGYEIRENKKMLLTMKKKD